LTQRVIKVTQAQLVAGLVISPPANRIWQLEEIGVQITEATEGKSNAVIAYVARNYNISGAQVVTTYLLNSSKTAAGANEVDGWLWAKAGITGGNNNVEAHANVQPITLTAADALQIYGQFSSDGQLTGLWITLTDITNSPAN